MGTCVTVIKLVGFSSLGLLSASLTYLSIQSIPNLIARLNNQVSISATSASGVLDAIAHKLTLSKLANVFLSAVSSGMFYLAYKYSPVLEQHPYLIYSGLGAPLALATLYVQGNGADSSISKHSAVRKSKLSKKKSSETQKPVAQPPLPAPKEEEEDQLDKSYIHVSEDSLSNTLTPGSSTPGSPKQNATETVEPSISSVEQEVEDALTKKEYVHDLETLKSAYTLALVVSSVGVAICTIGLVGDYYFL
ncbi:CIC11C00000000487 [Sungouiella intermedia]|uniref:CIC11C00000000487 n=1 Tax=Sungouiella intermedia TaxID=45354 RepID=A0A1L0C1S8_9ASCO|nr:CIC11C00000000487 [[Candida] intermedia]